MPVHIPLRQPRPRRRLQPTLAEIAVVVELIGAPIVVDAGIRVRKPSFPGRRLPQHGAALGDGAELHLQVVAVRLQQHAIDEVVHGLRLPVRSREAHQRQQH
eukprot:SAG31_NODE_1265_length_9070_cov_5.167205_1_plen_102_part_00